MKPIFWTPLLGLSCVTLDPLLPFFNPIHCSEVSEETCDPNHPNFAEDSDPVWDLACTSCDEAYDWSQAHPWRESTLDGDYTDVRGIPEDQVERNPFKIQGGKELDAYFIESHGDIEELATTTIVLNHGNFVGIEHYLPRIRFLYELGYNIYVWDYRGFGKSVPTDPPTLPQMMSDARDAFEHASTLTPDPDKMIIYGMSIGGMAAGEMAAKFDGCAQMFEAAYNSVTAKIETNTALSLPGSFLTSGVAENDVKLRGTKTPTLIMHGDNDNRIHIDEARRLYKSLPKTTPSDMVIIKNAGHGLGGKRGGVPEQGLQAYGDIMMSFLEQHAPGCLSE
jgi:uncharacterized protein